MAKDPAFLFYSSDFLVGTITMDFEDRGKYITILCYMHQNGRVKEETIRLLVGFVSDNLKSKFGIDEDGLWYNNRLEAETEKRSRFIQSRLLNGQKGGRPPKIEVKKEKPLGYPKHNLPINENVIKDVIEYLNIKAVKNFKTSTTTTIKCIQARINDGYELEQFKKVIDIKCAKWLKNPDMVDYLRPETLFGSKFESYVNETLPIKDEKRNEFLSSMHKPSQN